VDGTSTESPEQSEGPGRVGRLRARLAEGLPGAFVSFLAALVLVAILYTVATKDQREPRGYAEFTISAEGCTIDPNQHLNADECVRQAPGSYLITFSTSLSGSTVVASRGSCCIGPISASIQDSTSVIVAVPRRLRAPIRASVIVP
jgi:hypothetical protein